MGKCMGGLGRLQKFSGPCASLLGLVWQKAMDQCFYWRSSVSPSQMLEGYGGCGERMNTFRDWIGSCSGPPSLACRWPDSPVSSHYPLVGPSQSFLWGQWLCWHSPYPDDLISTSFLPFFLFSYSPNPYFLARGVDSPGWLRTWYSKEWPWTHNTPASIS